MEDSLNSLQSILHEVEMDWRQTTGPSANPLDIALPLLDNTSVGLAHRRGEFLELKKSIEQALRNAVNEHFEAFNVTIGSYRDVVHSVANSRNVLASVEQRVHDIETKENNDMSTVSTLNENFRAYNEMIEILGVVEKIKRAPQELDTAFTERSYAKVQQILQQVYDDADEYKLWELPALENMKEYFHIQEEQLFGIIVEDLHNTIFSKRQFAQYNTVHDVLKLPESSDYSSIEKFLANSIETDIAQAATINHSAVESFINNMSIDSMDADRDDNEFNETTTMDENNPFNQILQLLIIVNKLGKLSTVADIILQRFSSELVQLVNRVVEDTKLKHPKLIKVLNSDDMGPRMAQDSYAAVVLQDLFWNFFKKTLFLMQNMRVMVEIQVRFEQNKFERAQSLPFLERFWSLVKKEAQHLIMTYISNDAHTTAMNTKHTNISLSSNKKQLFQFYKVQYDKTQTAQLKLVLQDLFPGFINSDDILKIDSPYIEDNKFLKQSKIIPADVTHMRYILEPFLLFIQGSSLLLPAPEEPLRFFNNFMENEFLPIVEEKVISYYMEEVEEGEALQIYEPDTKLEILIVEHEQKSTKVLRIFIEFKQFFNALLFNLNTSLQFRCEFMPVIFKVLTMFHDKIEEIYKELFTELTQYLEPNRELITAVRTKAPVTQQMVKQLNVMELKSSNLRTYFEVFNNSLSFILDWFDHHLVRSVDLNKTDLNVSQLEKLRKTWFFFQFHSLQSHLPDDPMDVHHTQKLILNDDLRLKYTDIAKDYKQLQLEVGNVLRFYTEVSKTA
jgi:exocyst complex component 4